VDRKLEAAAGTLGAAPPYVFFLVTLPLCLPGVLAGAVLCFAKAMGEFGATITFVSNIPGETQTLPLGDLHLYAGPRRRGGRASPEPHLRRGLGGRSPRVRVAGARPRPTDRGMSLAVEVEHEQGAFALRASFRAEGRLTALFGPSGSGKSTLVTSSQG
jgi:ABC-type multidrug transport system fused ATPase/permease subunit